MQTDRYADRQIRTHTYTDRLIQRQIYLRKDRLTYCQINRNRGSCRQTDMRTDRYAYTHTYKVKPIQRQIYLRKDRQTYRQINRESCRPTDRQAGRHRHRYT